MRLILIPLSAQTNQGEISAQETNFTMAQLNRLDENRRFALTFLKKIENKTKKLNGTNP